MISPRLALASIFALALSTSALAADKPDPAIPTPQAQALIDQVKTAYLNLHGLRLSGKLDANIDAGGKSDKKSSPFAAAYSAPAKPPTAAAEFRHEIPGQLIVGSTGQKVYLFETQSDRYTLSDAPTTRPSYRQLPPVLGQLLEVQNPSLLMAISANSISDVVDGSKHMRLIDTTESGQTLPTLAFTSNDGRDVQFAFDPTSHLLRTATYDLSNMLRDRGAEKVNQAQITIHYDRTEPDAVFDSGFFAWTPPASAREIPQAAGTDAQASLDGKPAPDFTLTSLDGQQVKLSDLKGSVVLLDFWATWCPPCVRSLPEINEIYKSTKDTPNVKVFAINAGEDKPTVTTFLKSKNLELPVLLDENEQVMGAYGIRGIPTTIIIKPDGTVAKTFVGIPPGGAADIRRELEAARKK